MTGRKTPQTVTQASVIFIAIGLGLVAAALWLLRNEEGPSLWLPILLASGWAVLAMVISGLLVLICGHIVADRSAYSSGDVAVKPRSPAIFLGCSALGLATLMVLLYAAGHATLIGAGLGLLVACYNATWAARAWPAPEPSAARGPAANLASFPKPSVYESREEY